MTGAGPNAAGEGPDEGSVLWLHAMVPGAEEIDLFEQLDAERDEQGVRPRDAAELAALLAELFDGHAPTMGEVIHTLLGLPDTQAGDGARRVDQPAAAEDDTGGRPEGADDGSAGGEEPGGEGLGGEEPDGDAPAADAVSAGQAAEMIARLLGGRPVDPASSAGEDDLDFGGDNDPAR